MQIRSVAYVLISPPPIVSVRKTEGTMLKLKVVFAQTLLRMCGAEWQLRVCIWHWIYFLQRVISTNPRFFCETTVFKRYQRPFSSDFTISKSKLFKTFNSFRSLVYDTVLTIWRKSRPTPPPSVPWSLESGLHKTQVLTCLNSSDLTIYLPLFQASQIPGKSPPPSSRPARFPAANGMFAIL